MSKKYLSSYVERRLHLFTQLKQKRQNEVNSQQKPFTVKLISHNFEQDVHVDRPKQVYNIIKDKVDTKNVMFAQLEYLDSGISQEISVDPDSLVNGIEEEGGTSGGQIIDFQKIVNGNSRLKLLTYEEHRELIQKHYWHSSSHILGYSIERLFPEALLTSGPATKDGFFYDFYSPSGQVVSNDNYDEIQKTFAKILDRKYLFERLELSKDEALDLFSYNKFKTELIEKKIPDEGRTSVYKIGDFVDLCTGPHVPHTGFAKYFAVTKHSSSYWLGNQKNESLQRVYGITFPKKEEMEKYKYTKEEALKRDHRTIGQAQNLFFFSKFAPGSAFFLNHGTKLYNKLVDLMRNEYKKRGYQEVISPNLFHIDLWKVSGHYRNYKENMFLLKSTEAHNHPHEEHHHETFGLKPMNCPGHCLIFKHQTHSYRDLPVRFADFGVLHRNEISGALSGLTRVRRFQQDDAHIFCREDQIEDEVLGCLQFLDHIYGLFGFQWDILLSTRPEQSMGSDELWEQAEGQLVKALDKSNKAWKLNKGDGAFYGPKIDIILKDALGREIQCGTIQLDFQLPIRFNLQYTTAHKGDAKSDSQVNDETKLQSETYEADEYSSTKFEWKEHPLKKGNQRPVIIHRAILGSVERFIAILTEHLAGKWPLWLSPRQISICTISEKSQDYGHKIYEQMKSLGYEVELDDSNISINKKIRNAQLNRFNIIVTVGEQEVANGTVDIRTREGDQLGKKSVEEFILYVEQKCQVLQLKEGQSGKSADTQSNV